MSKKELKKSGGFTVDLSAEDYILQGLANGMVSSLGRQARNVPQVSPGASSHGGRGMQKSSMRVSAEDEALRAVADDTAAVGRFNHHRRSGLMRPERMNKSREGEGSRGGHVIGHTASGKPIYHKDVSYHHTHRSARADDRKVSRAHEKASDALQYASSIHRGDHPEKKKKRANAKALRAHQAALAADHEHDGGSHIIKPGDVSDDGHLMKKPHAMKERDHSNAGDRHASKHSAARKAGDHARAAAHGHAMEGHTIAGNALNHGQAEDHKIAARRFKAAAGSFSALGDSKMSSRYSALADHHESMSVKKGGDLEKGTILQQEGGVDFQGRGLPVDPRENTREHDNREHMLARIPDHVVDGNANSGGLPEWFADTYNPEAWWNGVRNPHAQPTVKSSDDLPIRTHSDAVASRALMSESTDGLSALRHVDLFDKIR